MKTLCLIVLGFSLCFLFFCSQQNPVTHDSENYPFITGIQSITENDSITGLFVRGGNFTDDMTITLDAKKIVIEKYTENTIQLKFTQVESNGNHVLLLSQGDFSTAAVLYLLNGNTARGIIWKGILDTVPEDPRANWAYRDDSTQISYLWNGDAWQFLCTAFPGELLFEELICSFPVLTNDPAPEISWSAYTNALKYRYRWSSADEWTIVDSTVLSFTPADDLSEGTHVFIINVWLTDSLFTSDVLCSLTIDMTAPPVPVVSVAAVSATSQPTWSWNAPAEATTFRYQIDGENSDDWITVDESVLSYSPETELESGNHTLFVQSGDDAGNWSGSGSGTTKIVSGNEEDDTLFVGADGDDENSGTREEPMRTIQRAADVAATTEAHYIAVAAGTYMEDITLTEGISLLGGYNDDFTECDPEEYQTVISATEGSRLIDEMKRNCALHAISDKECLVFGVTIKSNLSIDTTFGIYKTGSGKLIVDRCTIDGTENGNAGLAVAGAQTGNIRNSTIRGWFAGIIGGTGSWSMEKCMFRHISWYAFESFTYSLDTLVRVSIDSCWGGIISRFGKLYARNSEIKVDKGNCHFGSIEAVQCTLSCNGDAGIDGQGNVRIDSSVFQARRECVRATSIMLTNSSFVAGDIIYVSRRGSHTYVHNCSFTTTAEAFMNDGADSIYISASRFTADSARFLNAIENETFICVNNVFQNVFVALRGAGSFTNNTLIGPSSGSGIELGNLTSNGFILTNNIIAGYDCGIKETLDNDLLEFRRNCIYDCPVAYYDKDLDSSLTSEDELNDFSITTQHELRLAEGNIIGNPLFSDTLTGVYSLQENSPAVDNGLDASGTEYGPVLLDIEGTARPQGEGYDIGAFESH